MTASNEHYRESLEKLFHEPNRLAIMSALCAAGNAMTFSELKQVCNLTDGNLNRHLKVLKEASAITIEKKFVDSKPQTTVKVSQKGLTKFSEYLDALSQVLEAAKNALPSNMKQTASPLGKLVRA